MGFFLTGGLGFFWGREYKVMCGGEMLWGRGCWGRGGVGGGLMERVDFVWEGDG